MHEDGSRKHEADQDRQRAGHGGKPAPPTRKRVFGQVPVFAGRVVKAALGPERPLGEEERCDEQQHDAGELGGAGKAVAVEPSIVDGDRQGPHSEELDGADIVQRLHERKRHARGERWASER
jgi:hypothetical protein